MTDLLVQKAIEDTGKKGINVRFGVFDGTISAFYRYKLPLAT